MNTLNQRLISLLTMLGKYKNFTPGEFRCKCGCSSDGQEVSAELLDAIQALRTICGFPFVITSGYRCRLHPAESAKQRVGAHGCGLAVDIAVRHKEAIELLRHALSSRIFTGIGISQKGTRRFIHLDIATESDVGAPRPAIWTY
jgi:zinc D-Ala-D-Ala carboxypeptidase